MINYLELEQDISRYVATLISTSSHQYAYHNIDHTQSVVSYTTFLAGHYSLNEKDAFIVKTSAWFHDTGHAYGVLKGHEETSVIIMQNYFETHSVPSDLMAWIGNCILATRIPAKPKNLLEMILCDADTWHLATPNFKSTDLNVKKEMEQREGKPIDDWLNQTISFLEQHTYFTSFCRAELANGKLQNLQWLKSLRRNDDHKNNESQNQ